ncbi:anti-sigma factor family protein [Streptomyces tsukubensis]|uniref:Zinc-finger domain-containing protein n=1 Tax=Streptomyces tsukubensis TaxID=83656 RepID=A0A1V4A9C4_9ACTN|nr:hypothetical protein [Streptomyces tsukubensis]OON79265.1 hypothetical protein B1H18_15040 [Streptomyces tsukubensis]QFR94615.1 hypothetical protein GBW32_18155 [Streptomyces tsukubensis]
MTSATDTAGHPEVSEISDLSEGLLPPDRTADVRGHLTGCDLCTDVYASLEEIRELLGTLPGPHSMPADVAERIDAALTAEVRLDTDGAAFSGPGLSEGATRASVVSIQDDDVSRETHVGATLTSQSLPETDPGPETRLRPETTGVSRETPTTRKDHPDGQATSRDVSRETSPPDTSDTSGDSPASGSTPGTPTPLPDVDRPAGRGRAATGPGRAPVRRPSRRRSRVALGAVFAAATIGLGSLLVQSLTGDDGSGGSGATTKDAAHSFSGVELDDQVADLIGSTPSAARTADSPSTTLGTRSGGTSSSPRAPRQNTPMREGAPQIPKCVARGIGRADAPIAFERGTYRGTRAFLVVLPHVSDSTRVAAYVVDAACVDKPTTDAGKVLYKSSYARR